MSINYAEPKLNTKMRKPDPMTVVKRALSGDDNPRPSTHADIPTTTERRRKSLPRLPVEDDEESDGAQADEEPLAGSRGPADLANVDPQRRECGSDRLAAISDRGRRHSMLV